MANRTSTAVAPIQVNQDRELLFSNAQVLGTTADTASTTELNLSGVYEAQGEPLKVIVNATALTGTLVVKLYGSASASVTTSNTLLATMPTVSSGVTGQYSFTIPQTSTAQYVKLFYTAGTSATVTAYITAYTG